MLVNGAKRLSVGGLHHDQFSQWFSNGLNLDIANYTGSGASFTSCGVNCYSLSSVQGMRDLLGFADQSAYTFKLDSNIDLSSAPGLYIPYFAGNFEGMNKVVDTRSFRGPAGQCECAGLTA